MRQTQCSLERRQSSDGTRQEQPLGCQLTALPTGLLVIDDLAQTRSQLGVLQKRHRLRLAIVVLAVRTERKTEAASELLRTFLGDVDQQLGGFGMGQVRGQTQRQDLLMDRLSQLAIAAQRQAQETHGLQRMRQR